MKIEINDFQFKQGKQADRYSSSFYKIKAQMKTSHNFFLMIKLTDT